MKHFAYVAFFSALALLQGGARQDDEKSCKDFVQGFYDWYVPHALADNKGPAWGLALKARESAFTPELLRAIGADLDAQAKSSGDDIVGLDFDPFLNSQDPDKRYVTGAVRLEGERCWVNVRGNLSGSHLVAELTRKSGGWGFVNFHYGETTGPDDENLLRMLKAMARERH